MRSMQLAPTLDCIFDAVHASADGAVHELMPLVGLQQVDGLRWMSCISQVELDKDVPVLSERNNSRCMYSV